MAVEVSVVVPFNAGACPGRDQAWSWVRARYEALHPDWQIVVGVDHGPVWSKGRAVADGVTRADGDVLVVADADSFMTQAEMVAAVEALTRAPWVTPHLRVRRINEQWTDNLLAQPATTDPPYWRRRFLCRAVYSGPMGGGITVLPRSAWDAVPIDSRFEGWGGEDLAWGRALHTLIGEGLRLGGDLWHLWHPPADNHRAPSDATEQLAGAYREAAGIPDLMAELVNAGR